MKCKEVKEILKHDPDAEIAANKGLVSHVRSCGECSEKYGLILKLSLATAMKDEMRLPSDFTDKVWKKIGEPNPSFSFLSNLLQPKWVFAAAAMAVILLFVAPLMNKSVLKDSANVIASKPAGKITAQAKQNEAPVVIKKAEIPAENVVSEKIIEKQVPLERESSVLPRHAIPGNAGSIVRNAAPVPALKAVTANEAGGNKVSAAGLNRVQEELTASYNKGEDDLKGDVAVSGNVFHPLRGEAVTLKYRIKITGKVIVSVYDRKGKTIKNIYKGDRSPGIYTESWNGTDDNGVTAAGGIYIIYLKTDSLENKIKIGIIK